MAVIEDESEDLEESPKKSGMKGILMALIGASVAGGIGFYATFSGMLDSMLGKGGGEEHVMVSDANVSFVPLETLTVSLGPRAKAQVLKFTAQLEVEPEHEENVVMMTPRILDVLNTFLRAVEEEELQDPGSLTLLRAQMLRRIQIVLGDGQVRDLLVTEFILN